MDGAVERTTFWALRVSSGLDLAYAQPKFNSTGIELNALLADGPGRLGALA